MINQLYNLKKFINLFEIAQETKSQEVRLTITELSLIISDINKLLSLSEDSVTSVKAKESSLQQELDFDGGQF